MPPVKLIPGYDDPLDEITMFIHADFCLEEQIEILKLLPDKTQKSLLVLKESVENLQLLLNALMVNNCKVSAVDFNAGLWLKDIYVGNNERLVTSLLRAKAQDYKKLFVHKNAVTTFPFWLEGGNKLETRIGTKKQLLIFADNFTKTNLYLRANGLKLISENRYIELAESIFDVEVKLIGARKANGQFFQQNTALYHADLAFLPISNGVIGSINPETLAQKPLKPKIRQKHIKNAIENCLQYFGFMSDEYCHKKKKIMVESVNLVADYVQKLVVKNIEAIHKRWDLKANDEHFINACNQLVEIRQQLTDLGYELVDFDSCPDWFSSYRTNLGGIIYDGGYLMPSFKDFYDNACNDINLRNIEKFKQLGFNVKTAFDPGTYWWSGSWTCFITRGLLSTNA